MVAAPVGKDAVQHGRCGRGLPFRLGGQACARPAGEGVGFIVAEVGDRLGRIKRP